MKKYSLIIVFVLVGVICVAGCNATETNTKTLSTDVVTSNKASSEISTTSQEQTNSSNSNISVSSKTSSKKSSSSNSSKSKTSSKIDPADEKMYEYVRNHQVTTKKATNMSKNELLNFIEKGIEGTLFGKFNLPDSLILTKGKIECVFEQSHVLDDQHIHFDDIIGEFDSKELQPFLLQFREKDIIKHSDSSRAFMVLPRYIELFNAHETSIYIDQNGSKKNTFNASLGTASFDILIYEKGNGKHAFHFNTILNNLDYLIGELEIQPDGSAKVTK